MISDGIEPATQQATQAGVPGRQVILILKLVSELILRPPALPSLSHLSACPRFPLSLLSSCRKIKLIESLVIICTTKCYQNDQN